MTMETLIESIRTALAPDATDEGRRAGADACRTILAALEPKTAESTLPLPDVAAIVKAVSAMGPDQLLEVAITRLRAALPSHAKPVQVAPLKFHIVPVPTTRGGT
jgi:hypothetical protein